MIFTLRRARVADASRVADLFHRAFSATFGHLYPPEDLAAFLATCPVERFAAELAEPRFAAMLGEARDGRLLGYVLLGPQRLPLPPTSRRWIVLRQLYLEEEAKGSGLAQALLAWALDEASTRGFDDICLTVYIDNHRARRFYEGFGFREIGGYPFQVGSRIDDDRILARPLGPADRLTCLKAPALGVPHGFLGRTGGASRGLHAGLNTSLGSADRRSAVAANRARALEAVAPGARLVTLHQVHSARCIEAGDWPDTARPHADALVTDQPGLALGILTADCAPVLFSDSTAGVIGAAHAGWRGALAGVLEATLAAMARLGARPSHTVAVIGPTISAASYEVGPEFRARFEREDESSAAFFADGPQGRPHFDLPGYCRARLARAHVGQIIDLGLDTCTDAARFFSYRRATRAGEPDYGRQLSLVALSAQPLVAE
ncbi:peptidoglycan editing factor PgeF [Thermaurantiacus sp.]